MSSNSNSVVPYSAYRAALSRGRVYFLRSLPGIGGFMATWAASKALDTLWEAKKKNWATADAEDPKYKAELEEMTKLLAAEKKKTAEGEKEMAVVKKELEVLQAENRRTIVAIKYPKL